MLLKKIKMRKLLYITNQISGSGGLERVLSIKTSYLADFMDYDVHIASINKDQNELFYDFSNKITFHNIKYPHGAIKGLISYTKELKTIVRSVNPQIIIVCDDGLKGFFVPKIIGSKYVYIYERHISRLVVDSEKNKSIKNKVFGKLTHSLMNIGAKYFDVFVVLTKANLNEWKSKNLKVIANPLSFYPENTSSLNNKKIIAVGKHCHQKGYDRLLKSWKIVLNECPDWILEIYGAFNVDHDLDNLSKELSIDKNVKLHKPIKNIEDKFLESSIHVLSSRFEGFGMVIIEAMSCGVPSISFDCSCGPSDIIKHKKDGLLIENGNIQLFSKALIELIQNEQKRKQMGKAAKINVKRYLPQNILIQWDELFTSLINK